MFRCTDNAHELLARVRAGDERAAVDFVAQMNSAVPLEVLADLMPAFDSHDKGAALPVLERIETLILVGEDDLLTGGSQFEI